MHLPHFLNFVEIHHKAPFISVVFLDALPAKQSEVVRTIEVLHSLVMLIAEQALNALFVLEINVSEHMVSLDDLVQNIEIERQLVYTLNLLDELSANRAPDSVIMV